MPAISMFYGLIVYMYFLGNKQHKTPHIHVVYQDQEVIVAIPHGEVLSGSIPASKMKPRRANSRLDFGSKRPNALQN